MNVRSVRRILPLFFLFSTLFLFSGCRENPAVKEKNVSQMKILQGGSQSALPEKDFEKEIRIELLGQQKSAFGGKSKPAPVEGVKVKLIPLNSSDITPVNTEAVSDVAGVASFRIKAGKKTGDHYLRFVPEGYESAGLTLRYTVGLQISGGNQEWIAGELLPEI